MYVYIYIYIDIYSGDILVNLSCLASYITTLWAFMNKAQLNQITTSTYLQDGMH